MNEMKIILGLMVMVLGNVALMVAQTIDADVRLISKQKIFAEGTQNACHASTLVETTPGAFMAAWFAGSREGANDVKIWNSTYKKGHWSTPHEIIGGVDSIGNPLPCWNPVLFKTRKHSLFLF
jgi:predicted neuraminidase